MKQLPEIRKENGLATFYVDGKPFIGLGGELFNSSSSSTEWMREKVWPALRPLHVNSVIATVSWEQIEPEEGVFDFTVVDDLIADAAKEGLKLVLIWFALWKNGASTYVPEWMKLNREKYWVCRPLSGTRVLSAFFGSVVDDTISPLCEEAVAADAKAFARLMNHIHEVDQDGTVIMMQVENEIGVIGSDRDASDVANSVFNAQIPEKVAKEYGVTGTWEEAFGTEACEHFMSWAYASAVEKIASAGKREHNIPMYCNAWLEKHPDRPGIYPSGGPIAKMMRMWRLAAPSIDLQAPDGYTSSINEVLKEYTADGNPLFIPETGTNVRAASIVFAAVCEYNAMGFNPFGIESVFGPQRELENGVLMGLNIEANAFANSGTQNYLPDSYQLLRSMMHLIIPARGTGHLRGFTQDHDESGVTFHFAEYDVQIGYGRAVQGKPTAGGAILEVSDNEFYVFGTNFSATFLPKVGEGVFVKPLRIEEGRFENEKWVRGRILNGDELRANLPFKPSVLRVRLYKYSAH